MELHKAVKILFLPVLVISGFQESFSQDFSYEGNMGPEHWREIYNTCDGKYQSPINIDIHGVEKISLPPLQMSGFNITPEIAYIRNNGHTVQVTMDFSKLPTITGGPLNGTYEFAQFHYHWGDNDTYGSEDMIDNQTYPIELHIVFYKTKYNRFENALNFPDGVVVLAYFYEISEDKNYFYEELSSLLDNIVYPGNQTKFLNGPMIRDLTTNDTEHYFTYTGSLTTPPCSEVVTWIDFATPIPISSDQLTKFRKLHDNEGHKLTHNYRPVQPLNGRTIYENEPKPKFDDNSNKRINNNRNEYENRIDPNEKESNSNDLERYDDNFIPALSSATSNSDEIDKQIKTKFNRKGKNSSSKILVSKHLQLLILVKLIFLLFN